MSDINADNDQIHPNTCLWQRGFKCFTKDKDPFRSVAALSGRTSLWWTQYKLKGIKEQGDASKYQMDSDKKSASGQSYMHFHEYLQGDSSTLSSLPLLLFFNFPLESSNMICWKQLSSVSTNRRFKMFYPMCSLSIPSRSWYYKFSNTVGFHFLSQFI